MVTSPDRDRDLHEPTRESKHTSRALALKSVVRPFARTGRYYIQTRRDHRGAQSRRDCRDGTQTELPVVRPTVGLAAQALRDEVILLGLQLSRPVSEGEAFERITREVTDFYGQHGWLAYPKAFFAPPTPLTHLTIRGVRRGRRSYQRFVFESGYAPYVGEPGRDRWLGYGATSREYG
jgi:hypothetical protein